MTRPRLDGTSDFHYRCAECGQLMVLPALCITPDEEVLKRRYLCGTCGADAYELYEINRCVTCVEMEGVDDA